MGIHTSPQMADTYGVPTYYITDIIKEDAGGGNARIWNCQLRNGVLVPMCEIIIPSSRLLYVAREAGAFALELRHSEQIKDMIASSRH